MEGQDEKVAIIKGGEIPVNKDQNLEIREREKDLNLYTLECNKRLWLTNEGINIFFCSFYQSTCYFFYLDSSLDFSPLDREPKCWSAIAISAN